MGDKGRGFVYAFLITWERDDRDSVQPFNLKDLPVVGHNKVYTDCALSCTVRKRGRALLAKRKYDMGIWRHDPSESMAETETREVIIWRLALRRRAT
jgi:hypothetical protein